MPLLLAAIFALLLLFAGKMHLLPFDRFRVAVTDRGGPAFRAMNAPVVTATRWFSGIGHFFSVYSENLSLKEENARLLQWRGAALALQDRVKHYQVLLNTVREPAYSAVTAQVSARSSQPFLDTVVLNAGSVNGVKAGQAVMDSRGLLGRIYVVGKHTSWVILLSDLNSRIPVEIRPGNIPAILTGNNTAQLGLEAVPQNAKLKGGAEIVTSGDGGVLPAALPIGTLVVKGRDTSVTPYADPLTATDVRILNYQSPVEAMPKPSDKDLPAPPKRGPPPAQAAKSEKPPVQITHPPSHQAPAKLTTTPRHIVISVPSSSPTRSLRGQAIPPQDEAQPRDDAPDDQDNQ